MNITAAAADALVEVRQAEGLPESAGVRVSGSQDENGEIRIALGLAEEPAPGDAVTEQEGISLFVAPEVAEPLADTTLDVQAGPEGGQQLVLLAQG